MKLSLMRHEFNLMVNSRKNIIFLFFILVAVCSYVFIILPNEETLETFDPEQTEAEITELENLQIAREQRRHTGVSTGYSFFADNNYKHILRSGMLHAFKDEDFKRLMYLRTHYLYSINERTITSNTMFSDSPFPVKDQTHYIDKKIRENQHILEANIPVSYEMIEEKTALQATKNLMMTIAPYIIIFLAIYFSNDILVRDRKQTSTLQGLPVSWYQLINGKSIVAFFYTLFVLFGLLVITVILLTFKNGFGSFAMNVPTFLGLEKEIHYDYGVISMMQFFIKTLGFAPIFIFIFIRLNMIFSLLFRNEWIASVLGTLCLFGERFYYSRETRELFNIDISYFPQTYFDFGKVVTGEKNFLVNLETITYVKGMIVLLITLVLIELILFILSFIIHKHRFYET